MEVTCPRFQSYIGFLIFDLQIWPQSERSFRYIVASLWRAGHAWNKLASAEDPYFIIPCSLSSMSGADQEFRKGGKTELFSFTS